MKTAFFIMLRDECGPIRVEANLKVPPGFEIMNLGQKRGDPKFNDGQGSFLWELSIVRSSNNSATVGRDQCDGSSGQVTNSPHSVTGLARGAGPDAIPAGAGSGEGASTPARVSGEAADHG